MQQVLTAASLAGLRWDTVISCGVLTNVRYQVAVAERERCQQLALVLLRFSH